MGTVGTEVAARAPRRHPSGFTLVELMMVVAIIGILGAIAIPSFSRYVRKSRTAEAAHHLNKMTRGAVSYYLTDHASSTMTTLPRQYPGSATMPADAYCWPPCGRKPGGKCAPSCTNWSSPVWAALAFSISDPHVYVPFAWSVAAGQFEARIVGDQDADMIESRFTRMLYVDASGEPTGTTATMSINELE